MLDYTEIGDTEMLIDHGWKVQRIGKQWKFTSPLGEYGLYDRDTTKYFLWCITCKEKTDSIFQEEFEKQQKTIKDHNNQIYELLQLTLNRKKYANVLRNENCSCSGHESQGLQQL